MFKRYFIPAIVAVIALAACTKEMEEIGPQPAGPVASDNVRTLSVGIEAGSYVLADGGTKASMEPVVRVNWEENDAVSVVNATKGKILGGFIRATESGTNVVFSGDVTGTIEDGDVLYYIYPRLSESPTETEFSGDGYDISLANQTYDDENPGRVCFFGYAADQASSSSISKHIKFNIVTSYVHLNMANLPAAGFNLSSIDISKVNKGFKWSLSGTDLKADAFGVNEGISVNCRNTEISESGNAVVHFAIPASEAATDSRVITVNKAYSNANYTKAEREASLYYNQLYSNWTNQNVSVNPSASDKTEVTISNNGSTETAEGILPVSSEGGSASAFNAEKPTEISLGGLGTITFNQHASAAIKNNAGESTSVFFKVEDVTQSKPVDNANLVYEITMKTLDNNGTEVFSKNNAGAESEATVVIELGQSVQSVQSVSLVDDNGNPIGDDAVKNVNFDLQTGKLSFTVIHFSKYAITYTEKQSEQQNYAAQIGGRKYETLASAIAAATASQTIEILSDIALDSPIEIKKPGITIDGNGKTIAVSDDEYWNQYKVGGSNQDLGKCNMISVSADNFTLKNVTLDCKDCRGVSLCTTTGGKNATYHKITYKGKGSGHYYGSAANEGVLTFTDCIFETCAYAIHTAEGATDLVVSNCNIDGWVSYGSNTKSATFTNCHFCSAEESVNGTIATIRAYCPTTITGCTFSKEFLSKERFRGMTVRNNVVVSLKGCSVENGELCDIANIYNSDDEWIDGGIIAIDATGNATDGFTDGTFVVKQASDIKVKSGYGYFAIEGKTNVYEVREKAIATQAEFETACAAAVSGDKIVLGNGNFAIGPVDINGKTLTFKGQGATNTKIFIGNGGYDGNGGHGSNKTANMTFEDVTLDDLASDAGYLTGFTEAAGLTFRNVTFNVGFSNWGNKGGNVSFYNCTFKQDAEGKYNVQELRSASNTHYLFDGCTFNSTPGRFINAYKEGGSTKFIEIIVKNCSFNGTNQSKAAVNLKSGADGCSINCYFLGRNTVNNVKVQHEATGSALFADEAGTCAKVYVGASKETAVLIWENQARTEQYIKPEDFNPQS